MLRSDGPGDGFPWRPTPEYVEDSALASLVNPDSLDQLREATDGRR